MVRKAQFLIYDCFLNLFFVSGVEGWQSSNQLVEEGSKGVEVNSIGMSFSKIRGEVPEDHLRRHVLCTATEGVSEFFFFYVGFG